MNPHPSLEAQDRPARLTVGVVGAGRVGPALAASLQLAGHRPVAVSGVSDASVRRAADLLPGVPLVPPAEVLARADLVLLTVPDDALADLVHGLAETGAVRPGQLLVHTSGRFGTAVLEPATRAGALPLALHPAMTFTGTSVDVQRLAGCAFGVTAPEELRMAAEALVIEMGGEPEWIAESARPLYHAALSIGANYLVTLVAQAMELLTKAGVRAPDRMLGPLLGAALDNALRSGDAALTGPVARGDAGTVAAHVAELRKHAPQAVAGYLAMARTTADRALTHGLLKPELAAELLDVLAGPAPDGGAAGPAASSGGQAPSDPPSGTEGEAEAQGDPEPEGEEGGERDRDRDRPERAERPTDADHPDRSVDTDPASGPTRPESTGPSEGPRPTRPDSPDSASPDLGPHGGDA
ncbi:DUF2520 domain-containing protein [Streptomyces yunnanensis]|uniref:Predicted oxidoreductase, contains short-chain dehydrogenase (SDR) and DUF2520 domains n=1 Tax=Streptomyces yunnanensis TaxID=156453 RepID=A0A9X8QS27_9ACTN|nr:Predicted oxidoreductase, contains short-chain dehydrogenase (SDR) and DUF2520 domains [Streptomyces yunnanensis]